MVARERESVWESWEQADTARVVGRLVPIALVLYDSLTELFEVYGVGFLVGARTVFLVSSSQATERNGVSMKTSNLKRSGMKAFVCSQTREQLRFITAGGA
jgi:hypothetical protein